MLNEKRFPGLDALRGTGFLLIFMFHTTEPVFSVNWLGRLGNFVYGNLFLAVDLFFVLSIFLLTYLGLKEWNLTKGFSLKIFYVRRITRIWPLYFLILFIGFVIVPYVAGKAGVKMTLPDPLYYALFISNFYFPDHVFFLRFLWTISVEEQFYIVLSFTLKWFKKYLPWIFFSFILITICFSVYSGIKGRNIYRHPLTYLFDFGIGGLAAIAFQRGKFTGWKLVKFNSRNPIAEWLYLPAIVIAWFILYDVFNEWEEYISLAGKWTVIVYFGFMILGQAAKDKLSLLGRNWFLVFSGKISYGLYCFHGIAITFVNEVIAKKLYLPRWQSVPLMLILTYFSATMSYYLFEIRFLRLKNRWRNY